MVGLLALLLLAYLPALRAGFIWDDDDYVTKNEALKSLAGLARIWSTPSATPQYYPLVFTTFWLESRLWGMNPLGFHLTNVLLHGLAALLLFRLLRRIELPGAGLAAALFAFHPVMIESVAWITERKNVLSACFYLAAGLSYLRFRPLGEVSSTRRGSYLLALLFFVLALLSKTVTASWPAAMLLLMWWKRGRVTRGDILPLVPFFLLGLGFGLTTVWLEKHQVGAQGADWSLTPFERLLVAGRALWFYAAKLLWPVRLSFIYPRWSVDGAELWQALYPVLAVAVVAILFLRRRAWGRGPLVAVLFFVGTLVPALGLFDVYPMRYSWVADHFQYHASIGLLALLAAGMTRAWRGRRHAALAAAPLLLLLATLVHAHTPVYHDLETLWRDTLSRNPRGWMPHHNLGLVYMDRGRLQEAVTEFQAALTIREDLSNTHYNLGSTYARMGRPDLALPHLERALAIEPTLPGARVNLGNVLQKLGRGDDAMAQYRLALDSEPLAATARQNLAFALADQGDIRGSIEQYRLVMAQTPADWKSASRLAWLLATAADASLRNGEEAVRWAETAAKGMEYRDAATLQILAAAYAEAGRFDQAVAAITNAVELARAQGKTDQASAYERFRSLYAAKRAYHTGG